MADKQVDIEALLKNVEEYVADENQIVTYEWLSQSLAIHVNTAKELIEKYAAKAKLRNIPLTKVFSIGGTIGKNIKFCLATEAKLPQAKSAFDKILFTYTYSIQKGELTSFNSLYNSNYVQFKKEAQHSNEFSGIFCSTIRQRSANDLEQKYESQVQTVKPAIKQESASNPPIKKETNGSISNAPEVNIPTKSPSKENAKAGSKTGKPGIANFFAKMPVKAPTEAKVLITEQSSNMNNKRVVREPSEGEEEDEEKTTSGKRFKLSTEHDTKTMVVEKSKSNPAKRGKPAAKKNKATTAESKQRKRIKQISDSESSDDEGSVEMELPPPSPVAPTTAIVESDDEIMSATPQRSSNGAAATKNRSRKMVTKHHMDADGFIVTSKVYEECSGSEDEALTTKPIAPAVKMEPVKVEAPKRPPSPAKNKQSSITKFFTRK